MDSDKLTKLTKKLQSNHFEVFVAKDENEAREIFMRDIFEKHTPASVSYGDSMTMKSCAILELIKNSGISFIDTFNPEDTWREQIYKRKSALTADMFLTGCNAITEQGQLVNLDMIGNRVAAMTFGPRYVVLFVRTDKLVADIETAMKHIRQVLAPENAIRHRNLKLPCQIDGECHNCNSQYRICNAWSIIEKSYPKYRIKIILIDKSDEIISK